MNTLAASQPLRSALDSLFGRMVRDEPVFTGLGLFLALLMIPTLAALALDPRLFQGEPVWIKPLKFHIAIVIYLWTLAYFARFLPHGTTHRLAYRIFSYIVGFCVIAEMAWISGAAMWGVASHFNFTNAAMTLIYASMGLFAVILTSASLLYGVLIARNRSLSMPTPVRMSLSIGLVVTFFATVIVAGYLSSNGSHFVGAVPASESFVPLMGWSMQRGDLRVAHFFATHALHFIPLAGLLVLYWQREAMQWGVVIAASLAFTGLIAFTFVQARSGLPFIS